MDQRKLYQPPAAKVDPKGEPKKWTQKVNPMKILATADLHLGMKFSAYPEMQAELSDARFRTLEKLVQEANQRGCDLLVVAGDLFERITVAKKDILRAASTLNKFEGKAAAVLPGNHDYAAGEDASLWWSFKEQCGDAVLVLDKPKVYPLGHYDLDCCLYAGPCTEKHSAQNAVSWVRSAPREENCSLHIGVAHGSIESFSPDFAEQYYPMKMSELEDAGLDFWIIGHTHAQIPDPVSSAPVIFVPGTPEPDGFDCRHAGAAWVIETHGSGTLSCESVGTGQYRFFEEQVNVDSSESVRKLVDTYASPLYTSSLVKLRVSGSLPEDAFDEIRSVEEKLHDKLPYLVVDTSGVVKNITGETIEREFASGSFPYELLKQLLDDGDLEALQEAYQLIQKVRE
jgi:DNA repair exonuclease SbcCD nuclease subunit